MTIWLIRGNNRRAIVNRQNFGKISPCGEVLGPKAVAKAWDFVAENVQIGDLIINGEAHVFQVLEPVSDFPPLPVSIFGIQQDLKA